MDVVFCFRVRFRGNFGRRSRGSRFCFVNLGELSSFGFFLAAASPATTAATSAYVSDEVDFDDILAGNLRRKEDEEAGNGSEDQAMAYDR